jgi:hypothetical protein
MTYVYRAITIGELLDVGPNGHVVTQQKGDLLSDNGTKSIRFPVGTDGNAIIANSSTSSGLEWRDLTPADVGLGNVENILNNYTATVDPTVNDDSSLGYSVGSAWLNLSTDTQFILFDDTIGAAVWVQATSTSITAGDGLYFTGNTLNVGGSTTIFADTNDISVNSSSTANQILLSSGTIGVAATYGSLPLGDAASVSGTLPIARGGTSASSFTAGSRLIATNSGNTALETTTLDPAIVTTTTNVQTLQNKTFDAPIIANSLNDTNNNIMTTFVPTASAVNYSTVQNAAAAGSPTISVDGSDTNINLTLKGKGTGSVIITPNKFPIVTGTAGQVLSTDGAGNLSFATVPILSTATVTTSSATVTTLNTLTIATTSDTAYYTEAKFLAKNVPGDVAASFIVRATYYNNGSTLSQIGIDVIYSPIGTTWLGNISSTGTNIIFQVTGQATTIVNWLVSVNTMSV